MYFNPLPTRRPRDTLTGVQLNWQAGNGIFRIEKKWKKEKALVMLSVEVASMHNISVKLNDSQLEQVDDMAKQSHKSRSEILREAIGAKVAYEEYKREAIDKGMEDIKNGNTVSHREVIERIQNMKNEHGL